ncbi:MAG: hypothetical protein L6R41_002541 [Letrouitia leprolyta]|nr:MAG: hypothetical protein L6R41_002541 [Letrouitia leprolyta]
MKRRKHPEKRSLNPWLSGNFAPIETELPITPCCHSGTIPDELAGGEYIRNGGNPVSNEDPSRDAHWFDGDGMLSGVLFSRSDKSGKIQPQFTNRFILTDVCLSAKTSSRLLTPILPSIATLVNPQESLATIILRILRTLALVLLSHLPGSQKSIKKIGVANAAIYFHDGRALATCESGPPMRIELPRLGTAGWYNGRTAEGEQNHKTEMGPVFGGSGPLGWFKEWVTAHPKVDPSTKELILYHNTFIPPFVNYSIIQSTQKSASREQSSYPRHMLNRPVPGIASAKMMHDFGVSQAHTIIMDLPLTLDPLNLAKNRHVIEYHPKGRSRFGVFPRYRPQDIQWFETNPCCIFHTANSWTTTIRDPSGSGTPRVNMLCCRLNSAALVYSAGNMTAPKSMYDVPPELQEEEQCRLYYYEFQLSSKGSTSTILNQWALSAIPFEFPVLRDDVSMSAAKYIYGCSVSGTTFGAALGRAVKINSLVKIDVEALIARGKRNPPTPIKGCVDTREMDAILASNDSQDPIKVFHMPDGHYTQEARFVPRKDGTSEDDGWLLTYVFDESTQLTAEGEAKEDARSELWIIDAKSMAMVVAKVRLPQRVPYGFHGNWVPEEDIAGQRPIETLRSMSNVKTNNRNVSAWARPWFALRGSLERRLK